MKFSCEQQTLSAALNTVSKAVSTRTTIPVLKGILLNLSSDGILTLTASDLDLSIEKNIYVDVSSPGSIVVQAKLFMDIIRRLPKGIITIHLNENGNVNIKSTNSEFNIVGQSADEFPVIGEIEDVQAQLSLPSGLWNEMIKRTYFCASMDESKGNIVGVLMDIKKDSITMAALDGFRMAVTTEMMNNEAEGRVIINAKILSEIVKLLGEKDDEEDVRFIISHRKAALIMEKTKVVMRLMEGEFIKYKDIIPKNNPIKLSILRTLLLDAIDRASILAKEGKNNLIKCRTEGNLLTITSASEEGEVKEEIIVKKKGEDIEIGFNSKYIGDALKAVEDEEIVLELNTPVSPCLIKPLEGDHYEYLVLPVKITS